MFKTLARGLVLVGFLVNGGCSLIKPAPAPAADPGLTKITLLGTNDLHGWVEPHRGKLQDGTEWSWGGLEAFAGQVARVRAANPDGVVLVDSGDLFQGTLVTSLSEGKVVIDAYNLLGYDAVTVGNHEFDYGPVGPRTLALNPGDDPHGALEARAKEAKFPLLARNVYFANGKERPKFFAPDGLAMVERKGLKIGLVGLLTPATPFETNPVNVSKLRFAPLVEEAKGGAEELRKRGADLVIGVLHVGGKCTSIADPKDLRSCDDTSELFETLNALPPGTFDAVVGGHTHAHVGHFVNGMPVVQSRAYATEFGIIELLIDPKTKRPVTDKTRIRAGLPICSKSFGSGECERHLWKPGMAVVQAKFEGQPVVPDATVKTVLAPYLEKVQAEQARPLNVFLPKPLKREYTSESALGNAFADAMRTMEKTDVALLNSGGFRADLPDGRLTYGDLYEVFPFDNTISTLTLTGDELVAMLEALLNTGHGAPQTSGLKFMVERCGRAEKIGEIKLANGKPLDRKARYRVSTIDFLALGGDGTGKVLDAVPKERKDFGHRRELNMRDAIAAYLESTGGSLAAEIDGRMTIVTPASCAKKP